MYFKVKKATMVLPDFAKFYTEICRFDVFFGLQLSVNEPGDVRYRLTVGEQHLSMPNACHGGVLAAMMDAVLGLTTLSKVFPQQQLCQTVEFKINYFATPRRSDELIGNGRIEFMGSRLVTTSGELRLAASERLMAKGMGTFSLYPLSKKAHLLGLSHSI